MKPSGTEAVRTGILEALRSATAHRHDSVEALISLDRLADRASYERILQGFGAFHGPWEDAIHAVVSTPLREWITRRSRRSLLDQDLAYLGIARCGETATEVTQLCDTLAGDSAIFGSLYVMEGAALGGRVISRHLIDRLRIGPTTGGAYFHGHGQDTGRLWAEFKCRIQHAIPAEAGSQRSACDAACRTFAALEAQVKLCLFGPSD